MLTLLPPFLSFRAHRKGAEPSVCLLVPCLSSRQCPLPEGRASCVLVTVGLAEGTSHGWDSVSLILSPAINLQAVGQRWRVLPEMGKDRSLCLLMAEKTGSEGNIMAGSNSSDLGRTESRVCFAKLLPRRGPGGLADYRWGPPPPCPGAPAFSSGSGPKASPTWGQIPSHPE